MLVTLEDSENRRRYLNTAATLGTLLGLGVVPIVNENDTVATDEIRYGDNDRLAAQVAAWPGADRCCCSRTSTGSIPPTRARTPRRCGSTWWQRITPAIEAMAGGTGSALSKGGMKTKLIAAQTATRAGCAMAISEGAVERPVRGAGRRCGLHLVRAGRRPARGAQALDLGDEAARTGDGRRGRGGGARAGQVAAARRGDRGRRRASGAATRSRSPGPTGRWSPRRSRATMPARRG